MGRHSSHPFQPEQAKDMPDWERKMRDAGMTPFWDHVDDPLTELLAKAHKVRVTGEPDVADDIDWGEAISEE